MAPLVAWCNSSSVRAIVCLAASVTPSAPSCIWLSVRVIEVVAVRLASLISRAISSLLSIMLCVKIKPLDSMVFTARSVMRPISPAKCSPLAPRLSTSVFDLSSSRRVMSSTRCVMALLISLALPTMLRDTSVLIPTSFRSASPALRAIAQLGNSRGASFAVVLLRSSVAVGRGLADLIRWPWPRS